MTILVGFSASRQSNAPINLATRIARNTGESVLAAAVVERPWPPRGDPVEDEYLRFVTAQAEKSLDQVVAHVRGDLTIPTTVYQSSSVPTGLIELAAEHDASLVVMGSSSAGLLGRVALGSVTDRLVHTAAVPVAIAPRGYPLSNEPLTRVTAAYGGEADINGLLAATAELAGSWSVSMRIVSFTVRPAGFFAGTVDSSAEGLVIAQWARQTHEEIVRQLNAVRSRIDVPYADIVVGTGSDWREAVECVSWEPGDILALGSGAAGEIAHVFLGSVASKIIRHSPVPVLIVPRHAGVVREPTDGSSA